MLFSSSLIDENNKYLPCIVHPTCGLRKWFYCGCRFILFYFSCHFCFYPLNSFGRDSMDECNILYISHNQQYSKHKDKGIIYVYDFRQSCSFSMPTTLHTNMQMISHWKHYKCEHWTAAKKEERNNSNSTIHEIHLFISINEWMCVKQRKEETQRGNSTEIQRVQ